MSRTWAIVKREFGESVRSKMFIIGTLFGPLLIGGLMALQVVLISGGGGGDQRLAIVDASGAGVGARVSQLLTAAPQGDKDEDRTTFHPELVALNGQDPTALKAELQSRIGAKELDGYLWIPAGVMSGAQVSYAGRSATNPAVVAPMKAAVQEAVQSARLADAGIDASRLAGALKAVPFEATKAGSGTAQGSGTALYFMGYILGFIIYLAVMLFGVSVMRGVLEEKKDRIVEVVVSSIRADQLMLGKVLGIGGAGLLQMSVWVVFGALALKYGDTILGQFGASAVSMPKVPGSVAVAFLAYFAGGFFLYASMFAALGAMAASDQDLQQLQFPVVMCLVVSFFLMFRALAAPESQVAEIASWVPFSSPLVMPIRTALTDLSPFQIGGSFAVLILSGLAVIWIGARIYRIGILATGKKATMAEVVRWVRAG